MYLRIFVVYFWILILSFFVIALHACESSPVFIKPSSSAWSAEFDQGGGSSGLLHLPFPAGVASLCTQGAGGKYSHHSTSTAYDLDFDTSNSADEELYAPTSGTARVHLVTQTGSGFGTHVNIDRGDGTYVVVGHMKMIFVCDGCEVSAGQLIGYEGCTGLCTGDHVHVGLHQGDASRPAEYGVSIPATYLFSQNGETSSLSSEAFVCGVGGSDDPYGQSYTSALPVAYTHPDGTLVKTGNDPKVYVLQNGTRRWIMNEQVFASFHYSFANVVTISDEEFACYADGGVISINSFVEAVADPNGTRWLIVGLPEQADSYRIALPSTAWEGVLQSWGLNYNSSYPPPSVDWNHAYFTQWRPKSGFGAFRPGTLLKEFSGSAVYVAVANIAIPIKNWSVYLMLGFFPRPIVFVPDGSVLVVQGRKGDCQSGNYCLDVESVERCDAATFSIAGFQESSRDNEPSSESHRSPASDGSSSAQTPPARSSNPSDSSRTPSPSQTSAQNTSCPNGALACIVDMDQNNISESLLIADWLWTAEFSVGEHTYVYGNGGCFDGQLSQNDIVTSVDGYYHLDFSQFFGDCQSQLTLVLTFGTDSNPPTPNMTNWLWWQTAAFCAQGNTLCNLMQNGTSWEEWLLSVSWNPSVGLTPNGNGLTSNSQL